MEIDITDFFNTAAPMDYSASSAEIGQNAGQDTWRAACDDSVDYPLLDTDEKREKFRRFAKSTGGWDEEKIAAWSDLILNALLIQFVSGDIRESDLSPDSDEEDWQAYYARASEGEISGTLTRGDDGRIYYLIDET